MEVVTVLHKKYRPLVFGDVVGQGAVVGSLKKIIARASSQCFLFCGPSGTGKTTLARIVAAEFGCRDSDVLEVAAAVHTGVDSMRQVMESLLWKPFGGGQKKAIIIDEASRLSGNAWDSMLKATEEPPDHVIWLFCTTEPGKVPAAIKTRSSYFTLKPVKDADLLDFVNEICELEKFKASETVRDIIVREANGSPRQALVYLEMCADVTDRKVAADLLKTALEGDATIELCRFVLGSGGSWAKAMGLFSKLADENPEGIRIVVVNYLAKALIGAKSERDACHILRILDCFSLPYNPSERTAPLLQSIGRAIYGGAGG